MPGELRRNDRGGKSPPANWKEKFLEALAKTGLISEAVKVCGASRAHAYRERKKDPEFDTAWEEVIERNTEVLEQIAVKRAAEGSDTLMIFLLKARRPEVYRENILHDHQHDHKVSGRIQLELPDGQQPIDYDASKRREAARLLMSGDNDVIDSTAEDIDDDDE